MAGISGWTKGASSRLGQASLANFLLASRVMSAIVPQDVELEGVLLDGRYRILACLGRGGMSVVYEAEDLALARRVAVKLVVATPDSPVAERVFREAKAAARAQHPVVVTVFAYGHDEDLGVQYLVLELLHGEDLARRIARVGPLPLELVLRVGIEVSDALEQVSHVNVVHRDLKPANVFLASRGMRVDEVKLLDFGIAKALDMRTLTGPGDVLGTPAYMAPEQVLSASAVDARTDIYALGAVLYEAVTGERAFPGTSLSRVTHAVLKQVPAEVSSLRAGVPAGLELVISRCLKKDPNARFSTARELTAELLSVRHALGA